MSSTLFSPRQPGLHCRQACHSPASLQPSARLGARPGLAIQASAAAPAAAAALEETSAVESAVAPVPVVQEEAAAHSSSSNTSSSDEESAAPSTSSDEEQSSARREALLATIRAEVARRRNFAIISHPDAGKTSITEKLLLYGGAIHEAGEVKARANNRSATSDFMELEKARGISISSTAMTWQYNGTQLNLLDTPGHADFSEDSFRTLAAADNALLLIDGAKGIEAQTRKLFAVARLKGLPVFTFVNKMDRPAMNPFAIVEQMEQEFKLQSYPVNWPIGSGDRFCGVFHRPSAKVYLYTKGGRGKGAARSEYDLTDPSLEGLIEPDLWEQLQEEVELLEILGDPPTPEDIRSGRVSPMFFGSAMNNFGVDLFLQSFIDMAMPPAAVRARGNPAALLPLPTDEQQHQHQQQQQAPASPAGGKGSSKGSTFVEGLLEPTSQHFSGLVFKLQANMDPKHRDKVAFVRVVSGKFEKGMRVKVARTGRTMALSRPSTMFAQSRATVQEGFAGDVIGLSNPNQFAIGDTIFAGPELRFPPIPSFSPELFCFLRCAPNQKKAFAKGIEGLLGEGTVQVLYSQDEYVTDPILAAVGQLQFEVVQFRLKGEYGVDSTLEPLGFTMARWVEGSWPAVAAAGRMFNTQVVKDAWGRPVLLFRNEFAFKQVVEEHGAKLGELSPYALPPDS